MEYSIGRGSDGRKLLILWEKYGYQFPRLSPQDGFCCILPCYGKLTARPMHFTYEEMRYPNCFLCISLDGARLPSRFVRFFIHVIPTTPIPPPSDKYSTLECVFPRIKGASFVTLNIHIKWTSYKDKKPFASALSSTCFFSVKRAHHRNALQLTFQLLRTTNRLNQKPFLPKTSKMLFEFISTTYPIRGVFRTQSNI